MIFYLLIHLLKINWTFLWYLFSFWVSFCIIIDPQLTHFVQLFNLLSRQGIAELFMFSHKYISQYRNQGRPQSNPIILTIIRGKTNILGELIQHFFHFTTTYIWRNFSVVLRSPKYYVYSLFQRNAGKKQLYIEWHYFITW